jgi:hypothetical protein
VSQPVLPQLVVQCRMLHLGWVPADPDAVAALLPVDLTPLPNRQVFMHQYVVDDAAQTSGLDSFSVTSLGVELAPETPGGPPTGVGPGAPGGPSTAAGSAAPSGAEPAEPPRPLRRRWYTGYVGSTAAVRAQAAARGAPVIAGRTTIEIDGRTLVAVTESDGVEIIRTTARVGQTATRVIRGSLRYLGEVAGRRVSADHPYLFEPVTPFEVESVEFLPEHPVATLRPTNPLDVRWGFYSPRSSFALSGPGCRCQP